MTKINTYIHTYIHNKKQKSGSHIRVAGLSKYVRSPYERALSHGIHGEYYESERGRDINDGLSESKREAGVIVLD